MGKKNEVKLKQAFITPNSSFKNKVKNKKVSEPNVDKLLIENFVALQKVMSDMAIKFDSLTNQISKLLNLFENSAKSFSEKQSLGITNEDKDFLDKLDKLLEQNKVIAKGITLMEERVRERKSGQAPYHTDITQEYPKSEIRSNSNPSKQLPRF